MCVEIEMLSANENGRATWFPFDRWWRDGFLDRRFDFELRMVQP